MKVLILSLALIAPAAFANQELAQKKNCMACHALDKKLVGPAYKDVAAKYAKDKDAYKKLAEKIQKGGSGVWGPVPMPANAQVNPAEAETLASGVRVLAAGGSGDGPTAGLLLVAVDTATAARLAAASTTATLTVSLPPP